MSENGPTISNGSSNGRHLHDGKVRVAIVGVGNCASSLVQGVQYYRDAADDEFVPGLMHVDLGGYHIRDIEFVAAFDVDEDKVGKDLSEAIFAGPEQHHPLRRRAAPRRAGAPRHDARRPRQVPRARSSTKAPGKTDDIVGILREAKADVLVSYLPGRLRGRPPSGTSSRPCRPAAPTSTASRCSSPARSTGAIASRRRACRSSATTSSRRSARRSSTATSRASSATAACGSSAPTS